MILEEIFLFRKHEKEEKSGHDRMSGAVKRKEEGHGRMELLFGAFVVSFLILFKIKYEKVIKMHGHFQKRGSTGRTARTMKYPDSRMVGLQFISEAHAAYGNCGWQGAESGRAVMTERAIFWKWRCRGRRRVMDNACPVCRRADGTGILLG